jgi:hypothetical protein
VSGTKAECEWCGHDQHQPGQCPDAVGCPCGEQLTQEQLIDFEQDLKERFPDVLKHIRLQARVEGFKAGQKRMKTRCEENILKFIKMLGASDSSAILCNPYYEIMRFELDETYQTSLDELL